MPRTDQPLLLELGTLRQGRGLQATGLRRRIGPIIAAWCDLPEDVNDRDARRRLVDRITPIVSDPEFGADHRLAVLVALGVEPGTGLRLLHDRTVALAHRQNCSDRTARRRIYDGFERLAGEIAHRLDRSDPDDADRGWVVRRFRALVRLDTAVPELIEQRTIVATRDELRRISLRFSVPPRDGSPGDRQLGFDVQQGARIDRWEQQSHGHFHFVLDLPKPLVRGEEHTYTMVFRILDGLPIRDYVAFVPLITCATFAVRVRFDPARPPARVWRLNRCPQRVLDHLPPPGPPLALDGAGEIELAFSDLEQGFGYGLAWSPGE